MPTPAHVFARLAARLGGVDPTDREAVVRWYREELPRLSPTDIEACLEELLAQDGVPEAELDDVDFFAEPRDVPLPRLCDAPCVKTPLLARLCWSAFRKRRP